MSQHVQAAIDRHDYKSLSAAVGRVLHDANLAEAIQNRVVGDDIHYAFGGRSCRARHRREAASSPGHGPG